MENALLRKHTNIFSIHEEKLKYYILLFSLLMSPFLF